MKLIGQMVGRNEADRFLDEVLEHLNGIVDEIVFTDDCSDDDTPLIAAKHGANVYQMPEPMFSTHEGILRNSAWKNLSNHAEVGDWILAIDCDEKLWADSPNVDVRKLMQRSDTDVLGIKFYHMWNEKEFRVDKAWAPTVSSRLFRYFLGGQFVDKALACGSEPTYVNTLIRRKRFYPNSGLIMQHLGYVRDEDKKAKYDRYMELDGGNFHARVHLESIMDTDPRLEVWGA